MDYENQNMTAEMAVYDPNEDDRGSRWNPIAAAVLIGIPFGIPFWIALIAGVRWILHHAR